MKRAFIPVVFLLVFALFIQNTCPHGFAGTSSVAPVCRHCPMKTNMADRAGKTRIASDRLSVHPPLFVFAVQKPSHTFQLASVASARAALSNRYADALPNEILRPPQA